MKKMIVAILTVCVSLTALISAAYAEGTKYLYADGEAELSGTYGELYYSVYNDHTEIVDCDDSAMVIDIPAEIEGLPVTKIESGAFSGCHNLTAVTMPDSITSIGAGAFEYCTSLTEITIPENVASIDYHAFYRCSALASVNYNAKNSTLSGSRYDGVFKDCSVLTTINIGEEVKTIPKNGFSDCTALTVVNYNARNCTSMESVFEGCTELKTVGIGESVQRIPEHAFAERTKLESVYITDMESYLNIEFGSYDANPMYYANKLYLNNEPVTNVEIPDGMTEIPPYAFHGCHLDNVTIPASITSIGTCAFYWCSIENVHISDMEKYLSISFETQKNGFNMLEAENYSSNPMVYAEHLYLNGELVTKAIIPEGVTEIPNYAFNGCNDITSVIIPNSVTSIGRYAFAGCGGLINVVIPASVTGIEGGAFAGCGALKNVTIEGGVTFIDSGAFSTCRALKSITIPNTVKTIHYNAFYRCGLRNVYYKGSAYDWVKMNIVSGNDSITHAENIFFDFTGIPPIPLSAVKTERVDDTEAYSFSIFADTVYPDNAVYEAVYDGEGRLISVGVAAMPLLGESEVSVPKEDDAAYARIFIWNDVNQPVAEVCETEL